MRSQSGSFVHRAHGPITFLLFIWLTCFGCSPSRTPPAIPHPPIDYDRCRDVPLKLNNLTRDGTLRMVRCLNASGTLQPIEDWLARAPVKDLEQAFALWNTVVGQNQKRFEDALSILSLWNSEKFEDRTHLDALSEQLAALIDSGFAEAGIQTLRVLDRRSRASLQESFLIDLLREAKILRHQMVAINGTTHLKTLALLVDNDVGRFAAERLSSRVALQTQSGNSDEFSATRSFQRSIGLVENLYRQGKLSRVWNRVSLPSTVKALPRRPEDAFQIEGVFQMLTDPEDHGQRLGMLQRLAKDFDRPLRCFLPPDQNSSHRGLQIQNVFDFIVKEKVRRSPKPEALTDFVLRDLNLLVGLSQECEIDERTRMSLIEGVQYFQNMVFLGHASGHAQLLSLFQNAGRMDDLKELIKSHELRELAPVIAFTAQRGILAPTLLQVGRFISETDFVHLANFFARVAQGMRNPEWIFEIGRESRESEVTRTIDQFFDTGFRYVMGADTGVGPLLRTLLRADGVAVETPFVDALDEVLEREELVRSFVAFYPGLVDLPQFAPALRHFGRMAASGELRKLVRFLGELHRASGRDQLSGQRGFRGELGAGPIDLRGQSAETQGRSEWLTTVEICQGARDGMRSAKGLESGLKCLATGNKLPALQDFAGLLKRRNLLDETANWLQRGLFDPVHVSGSLATLREWERTGLLTDLNRSLSPASAKQFLGDLEFFLASPATRDANGFGKALSCVGSTLSRVSENLEVLQWARTFLDQKEDVSFRQSSGYRLRIHDEKGLREQMKQFPELMSMPTEIREKQFQLALKEFRERSPDYHYRQKTYPRYSTEQMKDELENYVKAFLNHTNLEELIDALGDLSRAKDPGYRGPMAGLSVAQVIDQIIGTQRVIPFYPGPGETPQVRVVTQIDQLEILVMNVDVDMAKWIPILGSENMGIFYIWNVAESQNLPMTLGLMRKAMQAGHLYTRFQEKQKHFLLENDRVNFYVLEQMAADGSLRLFQRIYQALYRSTPPDLRRSQDKNKNQIYIAHWPMKYGFMMRLVPILSELREQGKMDELVEGLFALGRILKRSDGPVIRDVLRKVLFQRVQGKSLLRHMFDRISAADGEGRGALVVSRFFQVLSLGRRLATEIPGGVVILNQILSSPDLALKVIDLVVGDMKDQEFSYVGHFAAGIHNGSEGRLRALRMLADLWLRQDGGACGRATADFLLSARARDAMRADRFIAELTENLRGTSEQRGRLKTILGQVEEATRRAPGLNGHVAQILQDPTLREPLVKILYSASTEGLLAPLIHELFLPSGENGGDGSSRIQELIQFINRVFVPAPEGAASLRDPSAVVPVSGPSL